MTDTITEPQGAVQANAEVQAAGSTTEVQPKFTDLDAGTCYQRAALLLLQAEQFVSQTGLAEQHRLNATGWSDLGDRLAIQAYREAGMASMGVQDAPA